MKKTLLSILVATTLSACTANSSSELAENNRGVVHDARDNVVRSIGSKNCVRTKWDAGFDECATEAISEPIEKPNYEMNNYTKNLLVFFDWDESNLTVAAKDIVSLANEQVSDAISSKFIIIGHADRSGSNAYNMKLSERRAKTVEAELKRLGVDGNINSFWRGEEEPLVQTEDNIREPQNRRVEIEIFYKVKERQ